MMAQEDLELFSLENEFSIFELDQVEPDVHELEKKSLIMTACDEPTCSKFLPKEDSQDSQGIEDNIPVNKPKLTPEFVESSSEEEDLTKEKSKNKREKSENGINADDKDHHKSDNEGVEEKKRKKKQSKKSNKKQKKSTSNTTNKSSSQNKDDDKKGNSTGENKTAESSGEEESSDEEVNALNKVSKKIAEFKSIKDLPVKKFYKVCHFEIVTTANGEAVRCQLEDSASEDKLFYIHLPRRFVDIVQSNLHRYLKISKSTKPFYFAFLGFKGKGFKVLFTRNPKDKFE